MDQTGMKSATGMAAMIARGETSAADLLQVHFDRVDRLNPAINPVVWQDRDAAMAQARACDVQLAKGHSREPLHGVPVAGKESFDLAGSPTTWGSPDWKNNIAQQDSDAVARYRGAGAIVYGKTNVPLKLANGRPSTRSMAPPRNPWDTTRTPGGPWTWPIRTR